jgi:hypothetical protein
MSDPVTDLAAVQAALQKDDQKDARLKVAGARWRAAKAATRPTGTFGLIEGRSPIAAIRIAATSRLATSDRTVAPSLTETGLTETAQIEIGRNAIRVRPAAQTETANGAENGAATAKNARRRLRQPCRGRKRAAPPSIF